MGWMSALAPDGRVYYFDEETGNRSWQPPCNHLGEVPRAMPVPAEAPILARGGERVVAGSISAKIDDMLVRLPSCCGLVRINPYWLRPWIGNLELEPPSCYDPCSWPRRLLGSLVYGLLFVPFIFSVRPPAACPRRTTERSTARLTRPPSPHALAAPPADAHGRRGDGLDQVRPYALAECLAQGHGLGNRRLPLLW